MGNDQQNDNDLQPKWLTWQLITDSYDSIINN